jgi:protein ImuA
MLRPPKAEAVARLRETVRGMEGAGKQPGRLSLGDRRLDARLSGGLTRAGLHEAAPAAFFDGPAAAGFCAGLAGRALAAQAGGLVWIRLSGADGFGAPWPPGLAAFGVDASRTVFVRVARAGDALWAGEEALRTPGLAAVILEAGAKLDLTAARRLQLAAEAGGAFGLVLRPARHEALALARSRWRLAAAPSAIPDWAQGHGFPESALPPGAPRWRAALTRLKGASLTGEVDMIDLEWRHETHAFHCPSFLADGSARPAAHGAAG